ncbi:MAG TPA: Plug domain-containing protein [Gemmatimonadaceae bacterium]|nr:Plug domain-containing protein [Gemmatimonadaceae bacterium]
MALASGAGAQQVQRDTTPLPDSVRAKKPPAPTGAPPESLHVRPDTTLKTRADTLKASTDTVIGDSVTVLGLHPGDTTTKIPKDTIKAPIAHAELPPVLGVGDQFTWTREEMFATGALTLTQLLELVPGVTTLTTGNISSPQFAAYAGNPGRVRVFLDGMELDNLDPRSGGALDLAELQLWSLEAVTIERGADELRVYCRTWTVQRTTTSTRIDVLTGDQRTNLYRAFFGRRYKHGEILQVGGQSYGTSSDQTVGGGNELALFARLGWASKNWSVDGYYLHADRTRDERVQDLGNVLLEPAIPQQDRKRADMYFRAGYGDPDSGAWAQAMVAHSNFTEHTPFSALAGLPVDSADTSRTSTQYIVTGGLTRWGLRLSGAERYHKLQTGGMSATEVRASFEHRLLALSLYAERRGADSSSTEEASARLTPLPFFAVSGTIARRHGGTAFGDEDEVSARLEAGIRVHQAWLTGGIWRRARAVVPGLIAFDTSYENQPTIAATGPFATIRGKIWRDIGLNVWAVRWNSPGYYRPQLQSHEELYIDTQWLQRFPSKHFRLVAGIAHEYRQDVMFPTADTFESLSDQNGVVALFSHALVGRIEFHILDCTIYFNSYSGVSPTRVEQVNGYLLPVQRLEYGIRWQFWN